MRLYYFLSVWNVGRIEKWHGSFDKNINECLVQQKAMNKKVRKLALEN